MKKHRLTREQVIELLNVDKSTVSRWLNPDPAAAREPSHAQIELLERKIADMAPRTSYPTAAERVVGMDPPEVQDATDRLRELHTKDPAAFDAAATVIRQFSSKVSYSRKRVVKTVASRAKHVSPASMPKSKADERSAEK